MDNIEINTEYIKLDQFLKWAGIAQSGAEAKMLIEELRVNVNGMVETKRGKKIRKNDIVEVNGKKHRII